MGDKENQRIEKAFKNWKEKIKSSTFAKKDSTGKKKELYTDEDYQHLREDFSEGASGEADSLNDAFPGDDY